MPSNASAATRPHYDLRVSLAFADGTLEVDQRISFRNNTGADLPSLVFHVTPAYFHAFSLDVARIGGQDVQASLDGSVLELNSGTPLPAGAQIDVELRYWVTVPARGGRFGRGEGMIALGNWFPTLAVYQDGWDRSQYVDVGDAFFTEVADFDLSVNSDTPVTIASSGRLTGQEGNTQSFHADRVRDFGMAISNRYQVHTAEVDGIKLAAFGLDPGRLGGYLDAASKALRWYSNAFGPYPYPTFNIAEIHDQGAVATAQEYPGLIFLYSTLGDDGGGAGSYSEYVIAHEVAHQWFYSLVGDDQLHDPWMDEAFATYADLLFYRDQAPSAFDYYMNRQVSGYRSRVAASGDRPVNSTIYDYRSDLPYFDIVYRKGAVFLDKLRTLMGDDAFFGLMRDYVRIAADKVAMPRAFLDMAYQREGADLPPLVAQYFSYGAFSDGTGYRLDVQWPDQLAVSKSATVSYSGSFPVDEAAVWLDSRLLYKGPGDGQITVSLDGIEDGEYLMRLDLVDTQGALYQRMKRVLVDPK